MTINEFLLIFGFISLALVYIFSHWFEFLVIGALFIIIGQLNILINHSDLRTPWSSDLHTPSHSDVHTHSF